MTIETDFSFAQVIPKTTAFAPVDLLGPLRDLVGPKPADSKQDSAKRKWKGHGFNLIWRPNFGSEFGPKSFFLQLNLTDEELDFTEITGTGIANRSLFEHTITLGGIAYTQAIKDSFDHSGQHFEPGVWAHVPQTANPKEESTIVRMGSIPHERPSICRALQKVQWRQSQHSIRRASRRSLLAPQTTGPPLFLTRGKRILARTTT
jgi:hypothetical protein